MNIGNLVAIFGGMKSNLVGRSMNDSTLQTTTRHPDREPKNVVIPPISIL